MSIWVVTIAWKVNFLKLADVSEIVVHGYTIIRQQMWKKISI